MKKLRTYLPLLLLLTLSALSLGSCRSNHSDTESRLDTELRQLDKAIEMRGEIEKLKLQRIELRTSALSLGSLSYEEQIESIDGIIEEYRKYQLDSTLTWITRGRELADLNGDKERSDIYTLLSSQLYSAAGFYNEAAIALESVDTLTLSPKALKAYYMAAHSYHRENREYSANQQLRSLSAQLELYYIDRLEECETDSLERHKILCTKHSNLGDWERVDAELQVILPSLSPEEQEFAYFSYLQALAMGNSRGSDEEYMTHLIRSAKADMKSLTKDHGSLSLLSEILFYRGDVEKAFAYSRISLSDANFYNSRLRPWQVASMMPLIEQNYRERIEKQQTILLVSVIITSLLLLAILLTLIHKSRHARQIEQAKAQLEEMNSQLDNYIRLLSEQNAVEHQLSAELSEANAVKEQYIGLFLVICSNYIDLLKSYHNNVRKKLSRGSIDALRGEIESSTIIDDAEEEFYANFDNAFLTLYPNFVDELNALLKEDQQIRLKNPRVLNTELRIVALIKLGITDSSRIAALLRYSVSTIYNYRSNIKNKARVERGDFEENIRNIGSIKSN